MSRYHGSKICGSQQQAVFCNGDGEQQKAIGLDWQKNNFACASPVAVVARLRHETS